MATMSPAQLFAEAVGLEDEFKVPRSAGALIQYMDEFCKRLNLSWSIEPGVESRYSVFLSSDEWSIDMEHDLLPNAIITGVAMAWSNSYHVRKAQPKVVVLNEWRRNGKQ